MMAIFYGSSQSTLPIDGQPGEALFHRVAHAVEYVVLAALLVLAAGWTRRALWTAFAIVVLFSITDEVHQAFVPGRHGRIQEIVLDSASAAAVLVAVAAWGRVTSQRQRRPST